MYMDPVVVPHTSFAGAHTNNPQYFERTDGGLRLITVCWLSVAVTAERVPAGRYAVALDLTADWQHRKYPLETAVCFRQSPTCTDADGGEPPPWEDVCPAYSWDPPQKGRRGLLRICEVQLRHTSDVYVRQQNLSSGWKGGTQWHNLILEPQPVSSPACEPSCWCPATEATDNDASDD